MLFFVKTKTQPTERAGLIDNQFHPQSRANILGDLESLLEKLKRDKASMLAEQASLAEGIFFRETVTQRQEVEQLKFSVKNLNTLIELNPGQHFFKDKLNLLGERLRELTKNLATQEHQLLTAKRNSLASALCAIDRVIASTVSQIEKAIASLPESNTAHQSLAHSSRYGSFS